MDGDAPIPSGSLVLTPDSMSGLTGADISATVSSFRAAGDKMAWSYYIRRVVYRVRPTEDSSYLLCIAAINDYSDSDDDGAIAAAGGA